MSRERDGDLSERDAWIAAKLRQLRKLNAELGGAMSEDDLFEFADRLYLERSLGDRLSTGAGRGAFLLPASGPGEAEGRAGAMATPPEPKIAPAGPSQPKAKAKANETAQLQPLVTRRLTPAPTPSVEPTPPPVGATKEARRDYAFAMEAWRKAHPANAVLRLVTEGGELTVPQAQAPAAFARPMELQYSTRGPTGIVASYESALAALDNLRVECSYDMFHDRLLVEGYNPANFDKTVREIRTRVLELHRFDPGIGNVYDALVSRCQRNAFNPVADYLDGLAWDGTSRIDRWLASYCGAEDSPLNRAIGRKMLIAGVRRARHPGCKFDYMVALLGPQGAGKSSALRILAGDENFSDAEIVWDKRDQQETLAGVWIHEIAEAVGLSAKDMGKIKAFASRQVDKARPAYARNVEERPRQSICVITANADFALFDTTGNRRFWPVHVGARIELEWLAEDRDQLWAEAAEAEAQGEPLVISEELWGKAGEVQAALMAPSPFRDRIEARLAGLMEGNVCSAGEFALADESLYGPQWRVSSDYLLTKVLLIPKRLHTNYRGRELANIMRTLGWTLNDKAMRIGGKVVRGYYREGPKGAAPRPIAHDADAIPGFAESFDTGPADARALLEASPTSVAEGEAPVAHLDACKTDAPARKPSPSRGYPLITRRL
jgi:hypothetical protein